MARKVEIIRNETCKCDICGAEGSCVNAQIPVIFFNDQTEYHVVDPYVSDYTLDICPECAQKVFKVRGEGIQGYNDYYIEDMDVEAFQKIAKACDGMGNPC